MARILVTGGAGFIGSHLVEELVRRGDHVRVLDNFSAGKRENLEPWSKQIEVQEGDVRNPFDCIRATRDIDIVFHEAAVASVPRSVSDPWGTNQINLDGTLQMLLASRENRVRRLVLASSSAIYGDAPGLPKLETMLPCPISPYALHKLGSEYHCQLFTRLYGVETVALRYFNVFGPRQDPKSEYAAVIPKFITRMLGGQAPTINGDGKQTRDFIYIKDVVSANLRAAEASEAVGQVINVARGESSDLLDLVKTLNSVIGSSFTPLFAPAQSGDVRDSRASIERMKTCLSFTPAHSFADGLAQTVEWYRRGVRA